MFHTCLFCIVLLPFWKSLGLIHTPRGRHVHMAASRDLVMSSNCVARYGELRTAVRAYKAAISATTRLYAEVFHKRMYTRIGHNFMIWPQILWIIQVMLGDGESLEIFLCRITAHLRVRRYFLWRSPAGRIGAKPQLCGISVDFHAAKAMIYWREGLVKLNLFFCQLAYGWVPPESVWQPLRVISSWTACKQGVSVRTCRGPFNGRNGVV